MKSEYEERKLVKSQFSRLVSVVFSREFVLMWKRKWITNNLFDATY